MQVKFEKFLALTALLASAQLNTACDGTDSDDPKDTSDAGLTNDAGATTGGSKSSGSAADGGAGTTSGGSTSGATIDVTFTRDGGVGDAATDAGDTSTAPDTSNAPDGAVSSDAGGASDSGEELTQDAAADGGEWTDSPDAGGENYVCDLGDYADESFLENCWAIDDTCYESVFNGVADLCRDAYYKHRADVAQAFWDCYVAQDIADPCTESAETVASECADAAAEGICHTEVPGCAQVTETCPAVDQVTCEASLAQYNSSYIDSVLYCTSIKAEGHDPGYEGCAYHFETCVYSPSVE